MYIITTFKKVFQYLSENFNNAKLQLLLHQPSISLSIHPSIHVHIYLSDFNIFRDKYLDINI